MSISLPSTYPLNVDSYHQMFQTGIFGDSRVELIESRLIEYNQKDPLYCTVVGLACDELRAKSGTRSACFITACCWLKLSATSLLRPDVALLAGVPRDYVNGYPTTALLIIEVGDDSLTFDQGEKASLYAKAGIQDYWIINLVNQQVEVYRRPIADKDAPSGFSYGELSIFKDGDKVAPLSKPKAKIAVADLLP